MLLTHASLDVMFVRMYSTQHVCVVTAALTLVSVPSITTPILTIMCTLGL